MKTTKILETEKGNTDAVHLRQIGGERPAYEPGTPHADGRSEFGRHRGDTPESDHRAVRRVRPCRLLRGGGRREIGTEDTRAWLNGRT